MVVKGKYISIIAIGIVIAVLVIPSQSFQVAVSAVTEKVSSDQIMTVVYNKHLKIALLTDALFSDAGWGAFAYNAAQAIKSKYGHELHFKDNVAISDIEATLRDYANEGYDLIIAHGFEWGEPAVKVGKDYPNTKFVVFTGLAESTNVASIFPMQQEGSFLLGAIAGMMSKTGVIGYIGGDITYPNLVNIFEGYKQGAKLMNSNVKVLVTYLGDFDNPAKGKEAAISQIKAGADFLLHVADTSGQGVIEAAKENGIYAFGAVSDQNKLALNTVLTSFVLDVDKAYDQAVKMVQAGNFTGEVFKPGLEAGKGAVGEGIVYLAPFHGLENKVPKEVKARLNQLTQGIINEKIIVPEKYHNEIVAP
jgi:basic membrane protein A and related proteins